MDTGPRRCVEVTADWGGRARAVHHTWFGSGGLTPRTVLAVLGLLLLFAAFFSAVLLALTSFARSFKEAQAYLIPLMLLSLTPGMLTLMPGVSLNGPLAVTPLVNVVLWERYHGTTTIELEVPSLPGRDKEQSTRRGEAQPA